MTLEEQHLEKLIYTLDLLQNKMTTLGSQLADLDGKRVLATINWVFYRHRYFKWWKEFGGNIDFSLHNHTQIDYQN